MATTKVYKIELMVIDHDGIGEDDIVALLEHTRYANHAISPRVMGVDDREVEWSDDHPLNQIGGCDAAYDALFVDEPVVEKTLEEKLHDVMTAVPCTQEYCACPWHMEQYERSRIRTGSAIITDTDPAKD